MKHKNLFILKLSKVGKILVVVHAVNSNVHIIVIGGKTNHFPFKFGELIVETVCLSNKRLRLNLQRSCCWNSLQSR